MNTERFFSFLVLVLVAVLAGFATVFAGSLTPSATPAATSYTLNDIYFKIASNTSATLGNHSLSTTSAVAASFHTLTEIYNVIPNGAGDANTAGPFTNNGDGTYTDAHTRLIWQGNEAGGSVDYASAVSYCDSLSLGGRSDWRLPTIKEWQSIADYTLYNPATALPGTVSDGWASTDLTRDTTYAWTFRVYNGISDTDLKVSTSHTARCVRP